MVISRIEEAELPEYLVPFSATVFCTVGGSAGLITVFAAGHHPKCRLVRGQAYPVKYSTATDVVVVEDGDGNDATADLSVGTVVDTVSTFVLTGAGGQIFERNEAIILNRKTVGNAANAEIIELKFESIY